MGPLIRYLLDFAEKEAASGSKKKNLTQKIKRRPSSTSSTRNTTIAHTQEEKERGIEIGSKKRRELPSKTVAFQAQLKKKAKGKEKRKAKKK